MLTSTIQNIFLHELIWLEYRRLGVSDPFGQNFETIKSFSTQQHSAMDYSIKSSAAGASDFSSAFAQLNQGFAFFEPTNDTAGTT